MTDTVFMASPMLTGRHINAPQSDPMAVTMFVLQYHPIPKVQSGLRPYTKIQAGIQLQVQLCMFNGAFFCPFLLL